MGSIQVFPFFRKVTLELNDEAHTIIEVDPKKVTRAEISETVRGSAIGNLAFERDIHVLLEFTAYGVSFSMHTDQDPELLDNYPPNLLP